MLRTPTLLAVTLALAACGGEEQSPPARKTIEPETGMALKVSQLSEPQRFTVLAKAVMDAGQDCTMVSAAEHKEVRPGVMGWKVSCENGGQHLVEIKADGNATVTSVRKP